MTKPRKALKSLFARTEPETDGEGIHREMVTESALPPMPPELEPVAVVMPAPESAFSAEIEVISSLVTSEVVESAPEQDGDSLFTVAPLVESLSFEDFPLRQPVAIEEAPSVESLLQATETLSPLASEPPTLIVEKPQAHSDNVAAAVLRVQYSFEVGKEEREAWGQGDYVEFIRRIDVAQAEAFFLKGKLLAEAKDRFFLENKMGWKDFSENILGMNYTTANQYIRVSLEFDVTSHRRPDFGFEHYKALLPLKGEERTKLMSELPQVSVKELRSIVQRKLLEASGPAPRAIKSTVARETIEILVTLKEKIQRCTLASISQTERWQLTAACRNLAEDLESLAADLNPSARRNGDNRTLGASAFSTDSHSGE